jgi:putative colanic acid biosynthesis acetyltransferase WcaF
MSDAQKQPDRSVSTASPTGRVFQRLDTTAKAPYPRSWYLRKFLWHLAWHLLYRPTPPRLKAFRVFLLRAFGAEVPYTANVLPTSRVWHPWLFQLGDYGCLADGVLIYNLGPVSIGAHTVLSQDAYVCAGTHDYTRANLPLQRPSVTIGAGVWVCTRAFIGPGVTIGDNSIVGACAVVMRDVPSDVIVQGNPAAVVKPRRMDELLNSNDA